MNSPRVLLIYIKRNKRADLSRNKTPTFLRASHVHIDPIMYNVRVFTTIRDEYFEPFDFVTIG